MWPGTIKQARLDGTYDIEYDDGDKEMSVSADKIQLLVARTVYTSIIATHPIHRYSFEVYLLKNQY